MPANVIKPATYFLLLFAWSCKTASTKPTTVLSSSLASVGGDVACQTPAAPDPDTTAKHFYDDDRLLTVNVTMKEDDWDKMRQESPPHPCTVDATFKYNKYNASVSIDGYNAGTFSVKKKSTCGSLSVTKPGLNFKKDLRDGKAAVFPDLGSGSEVFVNLTMNNSVQDSSYMRQCFGYQLMRDFNYPAPRCNYAKFCVNGKYMGMYLNVEPLDQAFAAHFFKDAGGIMVEGDWTGNMSGRHSDFYPDSPASVFDVKFPAMPALVDNFSTNIYKQFEAFLDADPATLTAAQISVMGNFIDWPMFRKFYLFDHLLGNYDGATSNQNNYYMYFNATSKRWVYLPWGMDQIIHGPPNGPYASLKLAKTYIGSPLLKKGLAADYAALVAQISEPDRKAKALAMAAKLMPWLSTEEQASYDQSVNDLTWNFWRELTVDPKPLFGTDPPAPRPEDAGSSSATGPGSGSLP